MTRPADLRDWKHCPICAATLEAEQDGSKVTCPACGFKQYESASPTTIVLILDEAGRLLLVKRGIDPRRGMWDTVGGFVEPGETAEDCARRETREELSCELASLEPLGTYTSVYGEGGPRTLATAFKAQLADGASIELSDENPECGWFGRDEIPELAFPDGRDAIGDLFGA